MVRLQRLEGATWKGHDVHVFTAARCNGTEAKASEVVDGINVHRFQMRIDWSYRMKVWKGLGEALAAGSFDVIHTYDYAQPHSRVALRAAKKTDSATALTVFDVHSMIPRTWYKQFPMKLMEGYLGKRTLPSADKVRSGPPTSSPLSSSWAATRTGWSSRLRASATNRSGSSTRSPS